MSRIAKWKLEKTKVKVVFRLQFHATHIPQAGWDKLFISFIPADSGKATAKTTKASVRNGTCKWADPIYETTRLLQDTKTKQYDEKHYKLVVAMGSSRASLLGEAAINLSDYADALKPCAVALPLHGCDSGAVLHVTVQLLTSKTGFREFEQQRELRERGLQTNTDQSSPDESSRNNQMDKVTSRVRFKEKSKEHPSLEEEMGPNEEYADSGVGFDGSSNTSGSLYAEKHDTSSTHEIDSLRSTISGDMVGLSQSPRQEKEDPPDHRFMAQGANDWVHSWGLDYSAENDLANAYEENSRLRGCLEVAESSINELKVEVSSLKSHADEIGAEALKFSQQLATEIESGEQLAKEVSVLKSECSKLKEDLELLQIYKSCPSLTSREAMGKDLNNLYLDVEFKWVKGLLVVEDKIRELKNKACLGYHEGDFRFLHSDLEVLLGVLQDLKQGTGRAFLINSVPSERVDAKENKEISILKSEQFVSGTGFKMDVYQPELGMLRYPNISGLVSHDPDSVDAVNTMKENFFELLRELDASKAERESLAKKMDQMECYYEALIQELEENQRQMLGELQSLRDEHSTCLYTVSTTKVEMETMRQDLNQQILRFAEDKHNLDSFNKELERRALAAEAALKRARLNYSIAINHLQKDLEVLSSQVLSMFETNENLIRQAFGDSSQPSSHGYPGISRKGGKEEIHAAKFLQCQIQNAGVAKQTLGGDILLEDLKRSLHLQEGLYRKVEEELCEMHFTNMYLDVFSKTLQETLLEASADVRIMKERMEELTWQLELSTEAKELLMQRLQTAVDEVCSLNEYKATCIAKCNEMALQNQTLEANLQHTMHENHVLVQKISEWESLIMEYRSYESKYAACVAEKTELVDLLKKESLENSNLQIDISSLQEKIKTMETEFDELATVKDNLQNNISSLQNKSWNLLLSCRENFGVQSLHDKSVDSTLESEDLTSIMLQLEKLLHNACGRILQLLKENEALLKEKDKAQFSLTTAESGIKMMKQKFENDIESMVDKLDASDALVQKLQLEIEAIAERLKVSSELEENYIQQQKELLSDFDHLEVELQQLTSKNEDLAQEILALGIVADELGNSKMAVAELTEEKQALMASLQGKSAESSKLVLELQSLRGSFESLHDDLNVERSLRHKLESRITDLSSQLTEKHLQLLNFDEQNSELVQLKQLVSDFELEKSQNCHLLSHYEECLKNARQESSFVTNLESQLSEMHEFSVAADVRLIFTKTQCEAWVEELIQQLHSYERYVAELQKKQIDMETALNHCLAKEVQCMEENARLLTSLGSLKSELEVSISEAKELSYRNNAVTAQLEEYRTSAENMEVSYSDDKKQFVHEVEQLKDLLVGCQEEIDKLMVSKEQLEVEVTVLRAKLDEQHAQTMLQERYNEELVVLQDKCYELTQKLSEQILKTEEFKNLSIHLKELKDKADAECTEAREKRESEGPPSAVQESLRIAFIKEQYETKLQELKQQLSISKRHSEEMLWKLQDAVDEIENRKKSEASHLKRNEELGLKILELEVEMQELISDRRENMKTYDLMKAELECSLISLECCKEEKNKLEASLLECNKERSKISFELNVIKELVENSRSCTHFQKQENDQSHKEDGMSDGPVGRNLQHKNLIATTSSDGRAIDNMVLSNGQTGDLNLTSLGQHSSVNHEEAESTCLAPINEPDHSSMVANEQPEQDVLVSSSINGNAILASPQENLLYNDKKYLGPTNDHFRAQSLKSSLDHLNSELERLKKENLALPQNVHHFDPQFPGLQRELMQLHKANEELGTMFPLFNEYSGGGNALQRVLALEMELAEALQAKKKSNIHFQSSFLKQHSDEEAIFQSFRDINDLISDMLELKGRYASVETELKEMHDRYSQLSLQFAEVEGERQKLMMTLKSVRASKKSQQLNRSSSASPGGHS